LSLITDIDEDLASMETGINRAAQIAAGAEAGAGNVVAHMTATGFLGIAQAMGRVRTAIAQIRARIQGIATAVVEVRRPVTAAPEQPTPEQSIAVLDPLTTALDEVRQQIGETIVRVAEVAQLTNTALRGGQPGTLLARLEGVRTVLVTVGQHVLAAQEHVQAALAEARASGAGTAAAPDTGKGVAPVPVDPYRAEPAAGFSRDPAHQIPQFVLPIAASLRVPPGAKAAGVLADSNGEKLHEGLLINGSRNEVVDNRSTLKPRWQKVDAARSHVEGHASGILRTRQIDRAVLVLTGRPCPGQVGCHTTFAGLLDENTRVDVYVADNGNAVYWGTYTGTGKGVAQR